MGLLVDAAKEILRESLIVGSIGAIAGASATAETISEKAAEKNDKKMASKFKTRSFFSKYKNHLLAVTSEKDNSCIYVFSEKDNQIKYLTSSSSKFSGLYLHDYNEKIIGSVEFGTPSKKGVFGGKSYSRTLLLKLGVEQVGTIELTKAASTKTIRINSEFGEIWIKSGEKVFEVAKEFKMSPNDLFAKKAYQIDYRDETKTAMMALLFIGFKEAKRMLKKA